MDNAQALSVEDDGLGRQTGQLPRMRIFFIIDDGFPTYRADISVLFGRYLPACGCLTDIVARRNDGDAGWDAGKLLLATRRRTRAMAQLGEFVHDIACLMQLRRNDYSAIQVRDKAIMAVFGLLRARLLGIPFFFWMSYPKADAMIRLAQDRRRALGTIRRAQMWAKGYAGRCLLRHVVLPWTTHIFVQSEKMRTDLANRRVPLARMTAVPMGVDPSIATFIPLPVHDSRLSGRRIIAYLGTCDRIRRVDFLFDVLAILIDGHPDLTLLIIGDAPEATDKLWLRRRAVEAGVLHAVVITGWLPQDVARSYLAMAEVGLAIMPPDPLLDSTTPTKLVEYLAMGKPVVANEHPDQRQVIDASGGGLCVDLDISKFAESVALLLSSPDLREELGRRGKAYVFRNRSYQAIASGLYRTYASLL